MNLVINGRLITRDEGGKGYYEHGAVAYEGTTITEVGEESVLRAKYPQANLIDAKGGVIMPAFINAHTHIYSALARGLSIVGNNPTNFYEVLDGTWWAIDRKLTLAGTRASATALYMDSIKQGVTTIFDHHASYGEIPGTLHTIAEESKRLGLRSCLCYEVSDRDGEEKCLQAIQENADFITECERNRDPMLAAMFGGHALFTISDKTFDRMVAANNGRTGYHIHVSEGMNDVYDSLQNYGRRPVQRLQDHGILGEKTILGHCIHVNTAEMEIIKETGTMVVNNPESNMGNAIGICPVLPAAQAGHPAGHGHRRLYQRHAGIPEGGPVLPAEPERCLPNVGWCEVTDMLFRNNAKIGEKYFPDAAGGAEGRRCGGHHRHGLQALHPLLRREHRRPHALRHDRHAQCQHHHRGRQAPDAGPGAGGYRRGGGKCPHPGGCQEALGRSEPPDVLIIPKTLTRRISHV